MSRIGGVVGGWPGSRVDLISSMLGAQGRPAWSAAMRETDGAGFGWIGAGVPEVLGLEQECLVVLDGFVYNSEELGPNLRSALVELYRREGIERTLRRLNGDFALAIYDRRDGSLWLARDRFGVRPLYYTRRSGGIAFASRPAALLRLPGVTARPDELFVSRFAGSHYRVFDNDPAATPYVDVAQLPAASLLRWRNGSATVTTYWDLEQLPDRREPEEELAEEYAALLQDAVSRRLRVARKPVFTLSGGLDSSTVTAFAAKVSGVAPDAISAVYDDPTFDESNDITPMTTSVVGRWHPVAIGTPDIFSIVDRMISAHDEPVVTATWLAHFLLAEYAGEQGFGSMFGGLGGDELNAGEYEYFFFYFADLALRSDPHLDHEIDAWALHHDHPVFRKDQTVARERLRALVDLTVPGKCLPDYVRLRRYAEALLPDRRTPQVFEPAMPHPFDSYLKNRTYQDLTRETAPPCLRAEDRQTSFFGLAHFLPFFDHRLSELMFRVPGRMKIRDGITKQLLRRATRSVLPDETRLRIAKTGWNAPAHVWFSGADREPLLDLIRSQRFRERGIYDVAVVERLADEHEDIVSRGVPAENHMMFFWQLVNLELWLRRLEDAS